MLGGYRYRCLSYMWYPVPSTGYCTSRTSCKCRHWTTILVCVGVGEGAGVGSGHNKGTPVIWGGRSTMVIPIVRRKDPKLSLYGSVCVSLLKPKVAGCWGANVTEFVWECAWKRPPLINGPTWTSHPPPKKNTKYKDDLSRSTLRYSLNRPFNCWLPIFFRSARKYSAPFIPWRTLRRSKQNSSASASRLENIFLVRKKCSGSGIFCYGSGSAYYTSE